VISDFVTSDDTSITLNPPMQFGFARRLVTKEHTVFVHVFKIITFMEEVDLFGKCCPAL